MTYVFKRLSALIIFIFITTTYPLVGYSQGNEVIPGPPVDHGSTNQNETNADKGLPPGDCDPLDPKCPIDGGLSALLALGAGYGIKRIRDARKAVNSE